MKYTQEQKFDIGRRIHNQELTTQEAADKYGFSLSTAQKCLSMYKRANKIPLRNASLSTQAIKQKKSSAYEKMDIDTYMSMTKEELIDELIRSKVNEARAKKGYEVRGVGAKKEYISLNNKTTK